MNDPNLNRRVRPFPSTRPARAPPRDTTDDRNPALRPRPLPNSYWATPNVLASEYPGTVKHDDRVAKIRLRTLIDVGGVRDFVDLTEDWELRPYVDMIREIVKEKGDPWKAEVIDEHELDMLSQDNIVPISTIRYIRLPIANGFTPSSRDLERTLRFLLCSTGLPSASGGQDWGRAAVVHCWGGIGRTGTVIGCYLVETGIAESGEEALAIIARKWKGVDKSWIVSRSPETRTQEEVVLQYKRVTFNDGRAGAVTALPPK